jgi:hypothetical protein
MSMTDLIDRLRNGTGCYEQVDDILLMEEAADEIDRLSRQLAEAQAELDLWRASFPGSAEAVNRDAHAAMGAKE